MDGHGEIEELLQDQYLLQQSLATLEDELSALVGEQDRLSPADAQWLSQQQQVVQQYKDYLKRLDAMMATDGSKQLTFQSEESTTNMLVRRSTRLGGERPRISGSSKQFNQQVIFDEVPPPTIQSSMQDEDVHSMFGAPPSPKYREAPQPVIIAPVSPIISPKPAPAPTAANSSPTVSTTTSRVSSGNSNWNAHPTTAATSTGTSDSLAPPRGSKDGTLGRGSFLGNRNSSAGSSASSQREVAHPPPSPILTNHHQPIPPMSLSTIARAVGSGSGVIPSHPPAQPAAPASAAALLAAFNAGAQRPGAPAGPSVLPPPQSAGSVAAGVAPRGVLKNETNFKSPTNVEQPIGAPVGIMWGFLGKRGGLIDANNKLGKILAKTVEEWQVRWVVVDNVKSMCYYGVIDASRNFTKKGEFGLKMATVTRIPDAQFGKQGVFKVEPLDNVNSSKEREHIFMHMYDPTMANMWIQAMALSGATLALDSAPAGLKTATLQRYSKELKKWQARYCVIDDNFGGMAYYEVLGDAKPSYVLRGHIPLRATAVAQLKEPKHGKRNAFLVATKEADFFFAADTDSQMKEWISTLVSAGVHAMPPQ